MMTFREALGNLGKSIVAVTVVLTMVAVAFVVSTLKLGLVRPGFFLLGGAVVILICAAWLGSHGHTTFAKLCLGVATITIVTIVIQAKFPGLFHLGQAAGQTLDRGGEERATAMQTPRQTPCSAPFFVGPEGTPRLWYAPREKSPTCYVCTFCDTRKGFHPDTREKLIPVTPDVVEHLVYIPEPVPTPTAAAKKDEWSADKWSAPVAVAMPD